MISKELLSEVLKNEDTVLSVKPYIKDDDFYKDVIMYECRKDTYDVINIYKLAHKCKEWAVVKKYYNVASLLDYSGHTCIIRQDPITFLNTELRFRGNTEPEAIFKACQWILDNKGK